MELRQLKLILEAALMAFDTPLNLDRLAALFIDEGEAGPTREEILAALAALQADYAEHAVELAEVATGYRFQTRVEFAPWVNRLWEERKPRYSRALLETLAIIAYRQPITRGEIEEIRGVAVSTGITKTLLEREWVRVVGHRDVPGKPAIFATTKRFLEYFNLKALSDLPTLAELKDLDDINPDLFAAFESQRQGNDAAGEDEPAKTDPPAPSVVAVGLVAEPDAETDSDVDADTESASRID